MKKLICLIGSLLFSITVHASYPMDGSTHEIKMEGNQGYAGFEMSYYQNKQLPSIKYFIKPFHCKIWTNYTGDPGYGVKITVDGFNAILEGSYPSFRHPLCLIITKKKPVDLYATFGLIYISFADKPLAITFSYGCDPADSQCKQATKPIVYEECNLTY